MNIKPSQEPRRRRAAIYARVSSSKQGEEGTIESQISLLIEHAKKNDLEIPEGWIFQDNGVSGNIIQRPALDMLRDLVAGGSPDLILLYHPDRLARKYVYQVVLLEEFTKCGVEVVFYKNKKAETPEEHLLEQFQGVFAEYERAQIAERCRRGRLYKAKQKSLTVLSNAPYGYRYVRDKDSGIARYEVHEEESRAILRLFQMYGGEGNSLKDLCSFLNQSSHKPRRSSLWDQETIRTILRNRAYTGLAAFGKTTKCEQEPQKIVRTVKNGRRRTSNKVIRKCPEEDWITIPIPAIISENLYDIVQDKLNEAQRFASRNTKRPSILQGVLVCGKCACSYYKKARTNGYAYYNCRNNIDEARTSCGNRSIRQKSLDDYVWSWIVSLLRNPELIEAEIKRRFTEDVESKQIAEREMSLRREQNKLLVSRNKLLDAYTEGECLSLEELKKRMNVLNQHIRQVERELKLIEAQVSNQERVKLSYLTLRGFAESLDNSSSMLNIEEKQRVVRALIDEIVVHEDSINIKHCIPISNDVDPKFKNCLLHQNRRSESEGEN